MSFAARRMPGSGVEGLDTRVPVLWLPLAPTPAWLAFAQWFPALPLA